MAPKRSQKGTQMVPKWTPKLMQNRPTDLQGDLGDSSGSPGVPPGRRRRQNDSKIHKKYVKNYSNFNEKLITKTATITTPPPPTTTTTTTDVFVAWCCFTRHLKWTWSLRCSSFVVFFVLCFLSLVFRSVVFTLSKQRSSKRRLQKRWAAVPRR